MDDKDLRKEIKREYAEILGQMGVVGANQADFVADRMVDMYRIAKDRLDDGKQILKMIYADNESAPTLLRKVMSAYVQEEIDKTEAARQLDELAVKTKQIVKELGANPEQAQRPTAIVMDTATSESERKLKSDILADAMSDTGKIDPTEVFFGIAEITMMDELAGLAKRIAEREPTHDELFQSLERSWQRTYEANLQLFSSEKTYKEWSSKILAHFEKDISSMLSIYYAVRKVAVKENKDN